MDAVVCCVIGGDPFMIYHVRTQFLMICPRSVVGLYFKQRHRGVVAGCFNGQSRQAWSPSGMHLSSACDAPAE